MQRHDHHTYGWSGPWDTNGPRPWRYVYERDAESAQATILGDVRRAHSGWTAWVHGLEEALGFYQERRPAMAAVEAAVRPGAVEPARHSTRAPRPAPPARLAGGAGAPRLRR